MRISGGPIVAFFAELFIAIGGSSGLAKPLGALRLTINGAPYRMMIPDRSWAVLLRQDFAPTPPDN